MASKLRIIVTTGDVDGIGWEVTAKALHALGPKVGVQFIYFRHARHLRVPPLQPSRRFKVCVVTSLEEVLSKPFDARVAIEVRSAHPPPLWVEEAAQGCLRGEFQALVTAPLSKTSIVAAGLKDIGHTEILARISGKRDLFMGFLGHKFSVVLMTGHQALRVALTQVTPERLGDALDAAEQLRRLLPKKLRPLPIALVGLNPHAGEEGLIGNEETWMRTAIVGKKGVVGPLVPDAAFQSANWRRYSVYVCPYHDQGLIPFKMVHGFKGGVHLTLGLPFVRTSVDHGTAKDLFAKGRAEFGSMKEALQVAIRLAKERAI